MRNALRACAEPGRIAVLRSFFRTGPGEYGEGDRFIGVRVPAIRTLCGAFRDADLPAISQLLRSKVHEERLFALLLLVQAFRRGDAAQRKDIYDLYLASTEYINNWDLVDVSAPAIVGGWLRDRSRSPLDRLARSKSLWERRIAILATQPFIRVNEFGDTFRIADILLADPHDLIHKAVGWMLREVGNRDPRAARAFLAPRYRVMPRTMLRYAIEKFPGRERLRYLHGAV